jgi:hypothetical protein
LVALLKPKTTAAILSGGIAMDDMTRREAIRKAATGLAAAAITGVVSASLAHAHPGKGSCKYCSCPAFKPNRIGHCINTDGNGGQCRHVASEHN